AGIIKFDTVKPSAELNGYARATVGEVGTLNLEAAVGGSLNADDTVMARLSIFNLNRDDWIDNSFTGESDLYGIDVVYKWAPNGNPSLKHLILQAEYIMGDESGTLAFSDDGTLGATSSSYEAKPKGFYTQAIYQFVPRWRVGVRYDGLQVDNSLSNNPAGQYNALINADDPERVSLMVDFSPSEFSRFRVQYNKDDSQPGGDDDQIFLQYIMSLGAHPAHQY
ncbi:MAG: hypothetical protein ACPHER_02165, partial [Nevskiales bacterium]